MDTSKLFQVLVVGGAMLGLGCVDSTLASDAGEEPTDAVVAATDAASDVDAGEGTDCGLCPNELCCEAQPDGTRATRPGMVCCWGTSC
ncbi:MAG: hypothetical protein KF729_24515 [Sandaracinaceae bacterium]|nr:hypothetical protein [Sandaracinaceae bacterium]